MKLVMIIFHLLRKYLKMNIFCLYGEENGMNIIIHRKIKKVPFHLMNQYII